MKPNPSIKPNNGYSDENVGNRRRNFLKKLSLLPAALGFGLAEGEGENLAKEVQLIESKQHLDSVNAGLKSPVSIYINWAAYDELSDVVRLDEALAMKQMEALLSLKSKGVRFDYYLMDMFWFDINGAYRLFRKESWPTGPDFWLKACKDNNIKPGLWFSTNTLYAAGNFFLASHPAWSDSLSYDKRSLCLFHGGYLKHLIETMQIWYDKGVHLFKFDFANFSAAPPEVEAIFLPSEIVDLNQKAWMAALAQFRNKNPDVILLAYNGYGGDQSNTGNYIRKTVDTRWLNVMDALYCGDPRPADVPCFSFWRSKDIYSDHQVRYYLANGIPAERIDNTAFMIGNTGTCYHRGKAAWKGMLILSLMRGGWANTYYGDLSLLSDSDAAWFAKIQSEGLNLQAEGHTFVLGNLPGKGAIYGFGLKAENRALLALVNSGTDFQTFDFSCAELSKLEKQSILYHDAGFKPEVNGTVIRLAPEQLVLLSFGTFLKGNLNLGTDNDVTVPASLKIISPVYFDKGNNTASASLKAPESGNLRIIFRQFGANGFPMRSTGGGKTNDPGLDTIFKIQVKQSSKDLAVRINYNKTIWSGLSWAVGEVKSTDFTPGQSLEVHFTSTEKARVSITAEFQAVVYQ